MYIRYEDLIEDKGVAKLAFHPIAAARESRHDTVQASRQESIDEKGRAMHRLQVQRAVQLLELAESYDRNGLFD